MRLHECFFFDDNTVRTVEDTARNEHRIVLRWYALVPSLCWISLGTHCSVNAKVSFCALSWSPNNLYNLNKIKQMSSSHTLHYSNQREPIYTNKSM